MSSSPSNRSGCQEPKEVTGNSEDKAPTLDPPLKLDPQRSANLGKVRQNLQPPCNPKAGGE
jgi:hypothetical protein